MVLTGVDITSYGSGLPGAPRLGKLVRQILRHVPELERLRISSIDSVEADADLLDAIADEPRLMPHLHLSLQHGDDLILKRMKRRHTRADAIAFTEQRAARCAPTWCSAPTSSRASRPRPRICSRARATSWTNAGSRICTCSLTRARPGTPAARMPQVPPSLRKERARLLRAQGAEALRRHLDSEVGARRRVLTERGGIARTEQFTPVRLAAPVEPGAMIDVTIAAHDGKQLIAA